jgi:hypothetical protein
MNRWYSWVLAPVMIGSAIIIPLAAEPRSSMGHVVVWVWVATMLLATLGLANPTRFRWALRGVAAVIVLAGMAYFVSGLLAWRNGRPIGGDGRPGSSLLNGALFLLVFGLPAFRYLLSGRSESVVDVIAAPEAVDEERRDPFD